MTNIEKMIRKSYKVLEVISKDRGYEPSPLSATSLLRDKAADFENSAATYQNEIDDYVFGEENPNNKSVDLLFSTKVNSSPTFGKKKSPNDRKFSVIDPKIDMKIIDEESESKK